MAAKRRYIDPATGDYVVENGRLKESQGISATVVLHILTPHGSMAVAPEAGNRIHEMKKLGHGSAESAKAFLRDSIAFLVERGDVRKLVVKTERVRYELQYHLEYEDRSGNAQTVPYMRRAG